MGRQELALLIPILALAIPVAAVILNGMLKMAKLRLANPARSGGQTSSTEAGGTP